MGMSRRSREGGNLDPIRQAQYPLILSLSKDSASTGEG